MKTWILLCIVLFPAAYGNIAALILARGGSKGVKLKNLQIVGGVSLLTRSVQTARISGVDDVTVSTDHVLIALEALRSGAKVLKRSKVTASDFAPSIWGAQEFMTGRPEVSILVLLQTTSPLLKYEYLRKGLNAISEPFCDCVFSVKRTFKLRWGEKAGIVFPMNFDTKARPRRQDWDGELIETGAFYIAKRRLIEEGVFQNNKSQVPMMSNSEEITYEELENMDVITVELVPERKGLILKHCEYYVSSRRHGTTVTRRYNEFVQLHDVLFAKYPYRAICRLPPKRVVVGGGSSVFLQRRRAALERWLSLVARHPVLAHDADLRMFLCESSLRLEKPKHDEFMMAGTQEIELRGPTTEEMQVAFTSEQEQLRLMQLGLGRLYKIFERVEARYRSEVGDVRELGAGLAALADSLPAAPQLRAAAQLAVDLEVGPEWPACEQQAAGGLLLALDALAAARELAARLTRGLHLERAAAAAAAPAAPAAAALRDRHHYSLKCSLQELKLSRAYGRAALSALPGLFSQHGAARARLAALWGELRAASTTGPDHT